MKFDILTLFPDLVRGVLAQSVIGRAQAAGHIQVECHNIRDYSLDKHKKTDDTPFGGGVGMLMSCQPIFECMRHVTQTAVPKERRRVLYLSPKGCLFCHEKAKELAKYDQLILLCGHYEGVDQRVIDALVDEEISIGDYVVTGGEIPACIVVDAVARLLPGVLAHEECYAGESVASGLLEYPQYTKPRVFEGMEVPAVLLSGDHKKIDEYRYREAWILTQQRRPDLLEKFAGEDPTKEKSKRKRKEAKPEEHS